MNITSNCTDLVKYFEGLRLEAYLCPADKWTIGYGHTGADVKPGMVITQERADELLKQDLKEAIDGVNKNVLGQLTSGQFDALVAFTFNLGVSALRTSTLLKLVNGRRHDAAAGEFKKWVYSRGKVLDGLVKRRAAEAFLYRSSTLKLPA